MQITSVNPLAMLENSPISTEMPMAAGLLRYKFADNKDHLDVTAAGTAPEEGLLDAQAGASLVATGSLDSMEIGDVKLRVDVQGAPAADSALAGYTNLLKANQSALAEVPSNVDPSQLMDPMGAISFIRSLKEDEFVFAATVPNSEMPLLYRGSNATAPQVILDLVKATDELKAKLA